MTVDSKKWWWEGYAALAWSLLLWPQVFFQSRVAYYVSQIDGLLGVVALLFWISALRHGTASAKGAAIVALLVTVVFVWVHVISSAR